MFRLNLQNPLATMTDHLAGYVDQPLAHRPGTAVQPLRRQGEPQQREQVPGGGAQMEIQFIGMEVAARQPVGSQVQLQFLDPVLRVFSTPTESFASGNRC